MWKVLIADDEPVIRNGLVRTISSSGRQLEVVATAEDGKQALELAVRFKPDLLLVDVCMPFFSGLQFLEKIRSEIADSIIIIVSGHDEFEYAREALRLGASDFILKPIDDSALLAAIDKAIETLENNRDERRYIDWAKAQLEKQKPEYRNRFFRDLVYGRLSESEIAWTVDFLGIHLPEKRGMLIARIDEKAVGLGESEQERITRFLSLESLVRERFPESAGHAVFEDESSNIVAFGDACDPSDWVDAASEIIERAERRLQLNVLSVQSFVESGESPAECYAELETALSKMGSTSVLAAAALEYMHVSYSRSDLSLEETADALRVSAGYLSRVLRRETSAAFTESLMRLRINRASALLRDHSVSVSQVAEAVGFSSLHYFSRTFKRITGETPMETRRGNQP